MPPYIHMPLHTPIPYVPHMSWGLGGICTLHMSWGLWGASIHLSGISVSVSTLNCLSAHNSPTSCSPSLLIASLLDWMPMDVCNASCCCSFLCSVIIMSQAYTTMAITTTPLVTVVCSSMSSLFWMVTMAPSLMGLPAVLTPRNSWGVVGLATVVQQQPPSQMPLQAYANYAFGPAQ